MDSAPASGILCVRDIVLADAAALLDSHGLALVRVDDDAVARLLGEERPMRFTTLEKKGFFSKLFGG